MTGPKPIASTVVNPIKLAQAPDKYDVEEQNRMRRQIELAVRQFALQLQQATGGDEKASLFSRLLKLTTSELSPRPEFSISLGSAPGGGDITHFWNTLYAITSVVNTSYVGGSEAASNGSLIVRDFNGNGVGFAAVSNSGLGLDIGSNSTEQVNVVAGLSLQAAVLTSGALTLSLTPNAAQHNYLGVGVTADCAITINDPSNPPVSGQIQHLVVEVFNNSGGPLTVPASFGTAYLGPDITSLSPGNGKSQLLSFVWSPLRSKWMETQFTGGTGF